MSSTNRSNARDSHISDYYVTPVKDIELFLKEFNKRVSLDWTRLRILDPCAGGNPEVKTDDNHIIEVAHPMSYQAAIHNVFGDCHITNIDIRTDSLAEIKADYLQTDIKERFKPDIIITNPPFALARDIIEKALDDVSDNGYVIMLLRLNFFGSKERKSFFENYMPEWCFVHHTRIGFTDKKDSFGRVIFSEKTGRPKSGSTDSIEYCHMVFCKGYNKDYTKLIVI